MDNRCNDLSGKDVSNLTELKFWLYGDDMPRDAECSMVYLLDNIRVVKQKAAPAVTASPAAGKVAPGTTVTLALAEAAENAVIHYTCRRLYRTDLHHHQNGNPRLRSGGNHGRRQRGEIPLHRRHGRRR